MGLKYQTITIVTVDQEDFKNKIKRLGIPQNEIAKDLCISEAMLSRWINGISIIPENMYKTLDKYIDEKSKDIVEFWNKTVREEAIGNFTEKLKEANK